MRFVVRTDDERCSIRRKRNETERTINRRVRHRLVVPTVGIEINLSIVVNSKNYRASRLLIQRIVYRAIQKDGSQNSGDNEGEEGDVRWTVDRLFGSTCPVKSHETGSISPLADRR